MTLPGPGWLIVNVASGSYSDASLEALQACLRKNALEIARTVSLPQDSLPRQEELEAGNVAFVVVYTGDGTLNAVLRRLEGWGGAVLVLPGGTMNLMSRRLHGELAAEAIVATVAMGGALRCRPSIIACQGGKAYAGLLAGPGALWSQVREAMRDFDVLDMASGAAEAVNESTAGSMVRVMAPALGQRAGYPLIEMTPGAHGIQLDGFLAGSLGEKAQQGWALLRRRFREGPHDRLGMVHEATLESVDGQPLDILFDGEAAQVGPRENFTMSTCGVDLLATAHG